MTRLTKEDEKRATEALAKCAASTKNIDDPEKLNEVAFNILYESLGDKPELLKRACEGYNSAKSVYRLGAATDEDRGNDFALLDAPLLAKKAREKSMHGLLTKAASMSGIKKAQFTVDKVSPVSSEGINKVASRASSERAAEPPILKGATLLAETTSFIEDTEASLRKIASERAGVRDHLNKAESSFISTMSGLSESMRKEAAEFLYALHGETGDLLVQLYNAARPMNKIASYSKNRFKGSVVAPDEKIYKTAADVVTGHIMLKLADAVQEVFIHNSVESIKDIFEASSGSMSKEAAMLPTPSYGADLAGKIFIGQEIVDNLPGVIGEKKKEDLVKDVLNTKLNNALRRHGLKRAFMNTVTDSTVARYPLHQVTNAFNDSLAELPLSSRELPPSAFAAILKSRTIARLGRGGAASGSDVDQILSMEKSYSDVLKNKKEAGNTL